MNYRLATPIEKKDIEKLKVGDVIYITGEIVTARDRAHQRALKLPEEEVPAGLNVIYHCGPLVKKEGNGWKVISAGPTTSARMNSITPDIIRKFNTRIIIGKGGMDNGSLKAFKENKTAYAVFTGGAGVLAASSMEVKKVHWEDLGMPEALWTLKVRDFGPLIVAMDSYGKTLFK